MKNHSKFLIVLFVLAMSISLLSGCKPATTEEPIAPVAPEETEATEIEESEPTEAPVATEEPRVQKDTIIMAQDSDVVSMDPHHGKLTTDHNVNRHIYSTLLPAAATDSGGVPTAGLAESYEQTSDTSYKFYLRKNVTFHDGSPFTAADVKFALERAVNSPYVKNTAKFIASVEIVDDYTVIVNTTAPYAPSIAAFSLNHIAIVPKAYIEANGDDYFALNPVGTGPYKFVEWVVGDHITLEAYDGYFDTENMPPTKNLIIRIIPESTQRAIALENGEIDFAVNLSATDLDTLSTNEEITTIVGSYGNVHMMMFNLNQPPFDNYAVREAITYAIDRAAILQAVYGGYGLISESTIAPKIWGYPNHDFKGYEYDVEVAKAKLADAGFGDGFSATLTVQNAAQFIEMGTIIQSMLKEIGIEISVEPLDNSELLPRFNEGKYDFAITSWNNVTGDADVVYYALTHSSSMGAAGNRAFINSPELDALLDGARAEVNSIENRQKLYNDVYDLHRNEILAYFPVVMSSYLYAASNNIEDYSINVGLYVRFASARVFE